jgi:pimeloyl-ACP methyl ester carboxylesterase
VSAPRRRPLLVAHGALGSAAQMQPIAEALGDGLSSLVSRVDVLEFPGHGQSPLDDAEAFSLPQFVEVMAAATARCETPPLLFGYSMGGYVALALEARAPRTFAGIVTLGTKFDWDAASAEREAARLDPTLIAEKVPRFAAMLADRHARAGGWEGVLLRTARLLRENGRAPLLSAEVLERIGVPVTVAVGGKDDTVSVDESRAAATMMLRATCEVLDHVPHPIERVPMDQIIALCTALGQAL